MSASNGKRRTIVRSVWVAVVVGMLLCGSGVAGAATWYKDADGDGWGDNNDTVVQETQPVGYVDIGGDFDDSDDMTNPGAVDYLDGIDNNSDGQVDENGGSNFLDLHRCIRPGQAAADRYIFTVDPGVELTFELIAQGPGDSGRADAGDVYLAFYDGTLSGSTLAPTYDDEGDLWATFSWTPGAGDAGQSFTQKFQGTFPDTSTSILTTTIHVTPEPVTIILMGTGLVGLIGVVRRRRKA